MAGRSRYIQIPGKGLVQVDLDYKDPGRSVNTDGILYNDRGYDGLVAPDGTDISSRSKHQAYMKANNLTTIDDFKDTWAKAEKARDAYRLHGIGGAVTKDDVGRAMYELEKRRR
jgi:hypothetical protein